MKILKISKPAINFFLILAMVFTTFGGLSINKTFASTGTVNLQVGVSGYTGGKDVSNMVEQAPNAGYYTAGQAPSYYLRDGGAGTQTNALIYFDLTGQIPSGATIDSASLSLYNTGNGAYVGGTLDLYRITDVNSKGMWVEGNSANYVDKNGAGWLRRAGTGDTVTTGWTNTAGSTITNSINTTATGNITFTTSAGWSASTDVKADIQAWANGTAVNQGWYLRVRSGSSINTQEVASNQFATTASRPKLTITYTTASSPTPTPTPTPTPSGGPSGYTFCANEGATCSFTGTKSVAYGANGTFNYQIFTTSTPCTNAVFGDPLVGVAKACYYQTTGTATPTPTPTPTATPTPTPTATPGTYLQAIQTYGNFETAGVDLKFKTLITTQTGKMYYKKTTDGTYIEGQPFVKYDGNHMATSLFGLAANTAYNVKIEITGSSGTTTDYTTVTTKPAYTLPTALRTVNVANQTQLNAAVTASLPGDRILLDPNGTYTGFEFWEHSGTAANPIVVGSQTSAKPVLSGGANIYHSNYITITNLELHGVFTRGASYTVVYNNFVHDGNSAPGNYDGVIMLTHSEESSMPGVGGHLVMNNIISDEVHDAIDESLGLQASFSNYNGRTYSGVKGIYNPGAFNTIRGNTIYGFVDGISPTGDEGQDPVMGPDDPDLLLSHPNQNMDVYDNVIYDMQDDGIETDGIVVNARIFRNQIGRSVNAITIAPTYPGPVYILRNTTQGSLENNMKMNTGVAGIVRNVFIYNNTFVQKTAAAGSYGVIYQGEPALTQDIVFKNNIFSALTRVINGDMYSNGYYHKRHVFDYNLGYSTLASGTLYKWSTATTDPLNNSFYTSLAAFKTGTGQEVHGVWGNPLLNLTPLAGYPSYSWLLNVHINSASSPAINAGVVIPGITNGFNGSAPDIGAYEY